VKYPNTPTVEKSIVIHEVSITRSVDIGISACGIAQAAAALDSNWRKQIVLGTALGRTTRDEKKA
jgi:hypothetical protein